ncbi:hypothetical protein ABZY14_03235 [Streptomyces sp. NPDC006617]|uniref:hypothetical protein n=1 Tax=Streptomyces sp. NPDC006617 TaxID=3155354 RepID=UPI0033A789A1
MSAFLQQLPALMGVVIGALGSTSRWSAATGPGSGADYARTWVVVLMDMERLVRDESRDRPAQRYPVTSAGLSASWTSTR